MAFSLSWMLDVIQLLGRLLIWVGRGLVSFATYMKYGDEPIEARPPMIEFRPAITIEDVDLPLSQQRKYICR